MRKGECGRKEDGGEVIYRLEGGFDTGGDR